MNKMIVTAAALLVLAGSTFQIAPISSTQVASQTELKTSISGTTAGAIPPPTCPANDPNGCGIFD